MCGCACYEPESLDAGLRATVKVNKVGAKPIGWATYRATYKRLSRAQLPGVQRASRNPDTAMSPAVPSEEGGAKGISRKWLTDLG